MKTLAGWLTLLVSLPMWYVLLYQVLINLPVEPWVWTIYWAYIPTGILIHIINKILE